MQKQDFLHTSQMDQISNENLFIIYNYNMFFINGSFYRGEATFLKICLPKIQQCFQQYQHCFLKLTVDLGVFQPFVLQVNIYNSATYSNICTFVKTRQSLRGTFNIKIKKSLFFLHFLSYLHLSIFQTY